MNALPSLLTSLSTALRLGKKEFKTPHSSFAISFLELLRSHGYILGFVVENSRSLKVLLPSASFGNFRCTLLSSGSRSNYKSALAIYRSYYFRGGLTVVSTSGGLRSAQEAVLENLGGQCLCYLYFS